MDAVSSVLPNPHAGMLRRFGLLLRQDLRYWRLPALFTVCFSILAIELASALRLHLTNGKEAFSFHWSLITVNTSASGDQLLPVEIRLAGWAIGLFLCLTFFFSGTFSDLFRPQTRARWLLLPAPLWEKLLSRWLCSMVLFPVLALATSAAWFLLRNPDAAARNAVLAVFTSRAEFWGDLKFLAVSHAVIFFLGAVLKSRLRVWPAFFLVLLLVGLCVPREWIKPIFLGLLVLWPLAWFVLRRSRG